MIIYGILLFRKPTATLAFKFSRCLANFVPIICTEIKALLGINISMGINEFPSLALFWSSDDCFGNQGIKKVMSWNRFQEN